MHLLAQCIQKEQVRQALQKGLRRPGLALAFVQDKPEQRPRRAPGGVFGTQQDPVGQALDNQRRQTRLETEEATDQADPIAGVAVQRLHGLTRLRTGACRVLVAGQAITQVAQQEHGVAFFQAHRLRLAVEVQPAIALHHQVEAGTAHTLGAGVPAATVAADMKQAGIQLQAF